MGQPIPAQHPSVTLRSHSKLVKAFLAIAMAAVIALGAAVVILANDEDQVSGGTTSAKSLESINYADFNPATGRPDGAPVARQQAPTPGTRYDGGPEEGTRGGAVATSQAPVVSRYDGGPEEGTRGPEQGPASR